MSKIEYERGKTMTYPGMYPKLLVTPVFAHEGNFFWVEKIICQYDTDRYDHNEPEFEFHRDTARYEKADALQEKNDKLRKLVRDAWGSGHADRSCEACDIMDECHAEMERYGRCLFERRIEQRMKELGVEVGE